MHKEKSTPLMEQYQAIKAQHKDAILFFRMGDFYEMFYEDARIGAETLGIVLTTRSHGAAAEVPLAGFPYHALDTYLAKMVKAGFRVAICEQVEDPKLARTIVKREVLEVVTPGTTVHENLLESKRNNYLLGIYVKKEICGLAKLDFSTGEFLISEVPRNAMTEQIYSSEAAELLIPENQYPYISERLNRNQQWVVTKRDDWIFNYDHAYEILTEHFKTHSLKGFGCDDMDAAISAAGAVLTYVKSNQKASLNHINRLQKLSDSDYMVLDSSTRRNLELVQSLATGSSRTALLSIIDQTITAMGGRMLIQWLLKPLLRLDRIQDRLDAVAELVKNLDLLETIRSELRLIGDLERLITRIITGRANARDLNVIKNTLKVIPALKQLLQPVEVRLLRTILEGMDEQADLVLKIEAALVDDPPLSITDGGLIRRGYHPELDELRDIAFSGKDWIAKLQSTEREQTGIASLKVNFNKVFGYYIEITNPHLAKVPAHYMRKQTLVNAERFITPALKEYEEKILSAEDRMSALEYELFEELRQFVAARARKLQDNAYHIATLDCLASFARIAVDNAYIRPEVNEGEEIVMKESRHPVIEKLLPPGEQFVPNDLIVNNQNDQILIITGPNMAGKSTYLRQVGLIVLMAQMGSYVPAKYARIGLVDKIFTRVGASDNLAAGESTFLTEMNETANILNNATPRSFILLDEIGRGTSTFDGLSIAWAVAEFLHQNGRLAAKTLFATHYHELTELARILPRVKNYNVAVKEWGEKIVFLRKIVPGGCDHSYGIHVAQLAGLPEAIIVRAREVLEKLEMDELPPGSNLPRLAQPQRAGKTKVEQQLSLFEVQEKKIRDAIKQIDINRITPLEALNQLAELKKMLE